MASGIVQRKIILTGAHAGKTIRLGSLPYNFENGVTTLVGSADDVEKHSRYIERMWQGYPEGHEKLQEAQDGSSETDPNAQQNPDEQVQRGVQPDGSEPETEETAISQGNAESHAGEAEQLPEGDGHECAPVNEKLAKAVKALDPKNDAHWTKDGRPSMSAVEKKYGATDITRADVDAAVPGYNREAAMGA